MDAPAPARLVYIGDPMCSWCWGFAPVLERLVADHDLDLRIIVGGLRPGPSAEPLSDRMKAFLLHHWDQVAAASGQPFDRAALEARPVSWVYDTELPAIAVAAMRTFRPDLTLEFFVALQEAFYAAGIDITAAEEYPALVTPLGVAADQFARLLSDPINRQAAWDDFAAARRLGVTGFPTTLLEIDGRSRMLAAGYRPFDEVDQILHAALDGFAPTVSTGGASCAVDGAC